MEANEAPERIWINTPQDLPCGFVDSNSVEYIRKDAFIEKALDFFENDLCCYIKAQNFTIEHGRLEDDFKKYMEGE